MELLSVDFTTLVFSLEKFGNGSNFLVANPNRYEPLKGLGKFRSWKQEVFVFIKFLEHILIDKLVHLHLVLCSHRFF